MDIRLHCTPEEVAPAIAALKQVFDVRGVSVPYADRRRGFGTETRLVRVYVEVALLLNDPEHPDFQSS